MPMVMTINGQSQLQFVPASRIKEFMDHGAQPIHLGDVLSALGEATETINRLTAENERLWKVAMKDAPPQQPTTVVVQQPAPQRPSALEKYLLLRSLLPAQPQPYRPVQIQPYPVINPNANRLQTDCTSQNLAGTTYTNCHWESPFTMTKLHRTGLLATQTFLWVVVTWLAYATWDGLVHLHRDSTPFLVRFDLIVTAIFVGFATFLLLLIGTVRGRLARQKR
jgi:hypothetical protein